MYVDTGRPAGQRYNIWYMASPDGAAERVRRLRRRDDVGMMVCGQLHATHIDIFSTYNC